jgi:hypothetical protein
MLYHRKHGIFWVLQEVRIKIIEFMIIIIIVNAKVLPNALRNTVAFTMLMKPIGNLL